MSKTLILVRGLPGSGKTTLAETLVRWDSTGRKAFLFAADDFFTDSEGNYHFNPMQLGRAHQTCRNNTESAMRNPESELVVVHNTFVQWRDVSPYRELALSRWWRFQVISVFDGGLTDEQLAERNTHRVPLESIRRMRNRWEW